MIISQLVNIHTKIAHRQTQKAVEEFNGYFGGVPAVRLVGGVGGLL